MGLHCPWKRSVEREPPEADIPQISAGAPECAEPLTCIVLWFPQYIAGAEGGTRVQQLSQGWDAGQ